MQKIIIDTNVFVSALIQINYPQFINCITKRLLGKSFIELNLANTAKALNYEIFSIEQDHLTDAQHSVTIDTTLSTISN
jgi:predicted nucleic acid-binding protein